jgi:hypothetical protein
MYRQQIFSPTLWGGLFNLETIFLLLLCRSFLISCSPICPSFLLDAGLLKFYLGILCLYFLLPGYSLLFLLTNVRVVGLILRYLIHFRLTLVQGDRQGSSFSFLPPDKHFCQQHLLKSVSNLHHINLCDECHWDFDGNCAEYVDCFW